MRHAPSFHPEWGYLAPRPGFIRTARLVIVASAVGAAAGAAVVISLLDERCDRTRVSAALDEAGDARLRKFPIRLRS